MGLDCEQNEIGANVWNDVERYEIKARCGDAEFHVSTIFMLDHAWVW